MPFGSIFGALFFGLCCTLVGLRWIGHPLTSARIAGALFVLLAVALAVGLLRGRNWARWIGALVSLSLVFFGLRQVAAGGGLFDHLLVFAALATGGLLIVPVTGRPRHGASTGAPRRAPYLDALGWIALASCAGLLAVGLFGGPRATPRADEPRALPASAISRGVRWSEFGPGMEQARADSKPILVTFVTDWCPYCRKMTASTWRDSAVAERLADVVTVKVDAEGSRSSGGFSGRQLAERYGVTGYPAQLLLAPDGSVIARYDGFQTTRQLLGWLDQSLGSASFSSARF